MTPAAIRYTEVMSLGSWEIVAWSLLAFAIVVTVAAALKGY